MTVTSPYLFSNSTYLVLGMGKSGRAAATWLRNQGAEVLTFDDVLKDLNSPGISSITDIPWDSLTAVIQSPGIPYSFPKPHPVTLKAKTHHIPILTDINLLQAANPNAQFVGITGTNGKSTTTALMGHILQYNQRVCAIGGNIGVPVLSLPALGPSGTYVLELSSFQLEMSAPLTLKVAAWLNMTPDHLDRHPTFAEYSAAKERIFLNANQAVINQDDDSSYAVYQQLKDRGMKVLGVSCAHQTDIWVEKGVLYDQQNYTLDLREIEPLQGLHNYQNAATAYATCKLLGLSVDEIREGLRTFTGLAHRQEIIGRVDNIIFVNDSKATNAEATAHALSRYQNCQLYWIAGGRPKSQGIIPLKAYFPSIHRAFLIGEAQDEFAKTLEGHVPYTKSDTLQKALTHAMQAIRQEIGFQKAVVLLSPACASYDQFESFEQRGEAFRQWVDDFMRSAS